MRNQAWPKAPLNTWVAGCFHGVKGCFWPCLISHGGHFLTKEISRDTSKKGLGTYPVHFHRVAAAAAAAAVGPFAGVKEPAGRTLRANNNP